MLTIGLSSDWPGLRTAGHRAPEPGVAEGEDAPVRRDQPVPVARLRRRHAHDRLIQVQAPGRSVEERITEAEDPPVRGHQPIATPVGCRRHAHDRRVQMQAARGPVEVGVAEAEDPPVGRDQPVATPVGRRRHAHDRRIQVQASGRAVERHTAEAEDPSVRGDEPVPRRLARQRARGLGVLGRHDPGQRGEAERRQQDGERHAPDHERRNSATRKARSSDWRAFRRGSHAVV